MTFLARVINVTIASPSDIEDLARVAREVVLKWTEVHGEREGLALHPRSWLSHSSPKLGARPQAIVNDQVVNASDMLIAIFEARVGTPTGEADSGTIEEINEHLKAGKPVMVYFSRRQLPNDVDLQQVAAVRRYEQELQPKSLHGTFRTAEEFRQGLRDDLARTVHREFGNLRVKIDEGTYDGAPPERYMSANAQRVLLLTAAHRHGRFVLSSSFDGVSMRAGDTMLGDKLDARAGATWQGIVEELVSAGYAEPTSEEIYKLRPEGYAEADRLRSVDHSMGPEARAVLRAAHADPLGQFFVLDLQGMLTIQCGNTPVISDLISEEHRRWVEAVEGLCRHKLARRPTVSGGPYALTTGGHEFAKRYGFDDLSSSGATEGAMS